MFPAHLCLFESRCRFRHPCSVLVCAPTPLHREKIYLTNGWGKCILLYLHSIQAVATDHPFPPIHTNTHTHKYIMFYVRFVVCATRNERKECPTNNDSSSGWEKKKTIHRTFSSASANSFAKMGKTEEKKEGFYGNPDVIIAIYPLHQ